MQIFFSLIAPTNPFSQASFKFVWLIQLVFLTVATYARYSHHGRVCSGDLIIFGSHDEHTSALSGVPLPGYVNVEGTWLSFYVVFSWIRIFLMIVLICCVRIYYYIFSGDSRSELSMLDDSVEMARQQ